MAPVAAIWLSSISNLLVNCLFKSVIKCLAIYNCHSDLISEFIFRHVAEQEVSTRINELVRGVQGDHFPKWKRGLLIHFSGPFFKKRASLAQAGREISALVPGLSIKCGKRHTLRAYRKKGMSRLTRMTGHNREPKARNNRDVIFFCKALALNQGLSVRSNICKSSRLKSCPGNCPYAPVVWGSGVVEIQGREFPPNN